MSENQDAVIQAGLDEIARYVNKAYRAVSVSEAVTIRSRSGSKRYTPQMLYEDIRKDSGLKPWLDKILPAVVITKIEAWIKENWQFQEKLDEEEASNNTLHDRAQEILADYITIRHDKGDKLYIRSNLNSFQYELLGETDQKTFWKMYIYTPRYKTDLEYYQDNPELFASGGRKPPLYETWMLKQYHLWSVLDTDHMRTQALEYITDKPDIPCLNYIDIKKMCPGPWDAWEEWESRLPEHMIHIFRAFIFSLIDPVNHGRQALWFHSGGYSGQSTLQNALKMALGDSLVGAISKDAVSKEFFFGSVYGKRILLYGDVQNTRLLMTEKLHSLLGGDEVQVERKFEHPFSAHIWARMIISGNVTPEINTANPHERTRLIFMPLKTPPDKYLQKFKKITPEGEIIFGDPTFAPRLAAQFWHYLQICLPYYQQLCPTRTDITIDPEIQKTMFEEVASEDFVETEKFMETKYEITRDENDFVLQTDFNKFAREAFPHDAFAVNRCYTYLCTQYNIRKRQSHPGQGSRLRILSGIRKKKMSSHVIGVKEPA